MSFTHHRQPAPSSAWTPAALGLLLDDRLVNLKKRASAVLGASQFMPASSQRLSIPNAAKYQYGLTPWTTLKWIYNDAAGAGTDRRYWTKGVAGSDYLERLSTGNQVVATLGGGSGTATVTNNLVSLVATGWYCVITEYDPAASPNPLLTVTVGAANVGLQSVSGSAAGVGSYTPGTTDFSLGGTAAGANFLSGRLADCAKWNRLLTLTEKQTLFNQGNGFSYTNAQGVAGLLTGCQWWFAINTVSSGGLLTDRVGGVDTLTNTNGVTQTGGAYSAAATSAGDPIHWTQHAGSAAGIYSSALTEVQRPLLAFDAFGNRWASFSGAAFLDDGTSTTLAFTDTFTEYVMVQSTTIADGDGLFGRSSGFAEGYAVVFSGADALVKGRTNATPVTWAGGRTYLNDGKPHLLILTRSTTTWELRVDGVRRAAGVTAVLNATAGISSNWGARGNGGAPFHGWMTMRGIVGRELTEGEKANLEAYANRTYTTSALAAPRIFGNPTRLNDLAYLGGTVNAPFLAPSGNYAAGGKTILNKLNIWQARVSPGKISRVRFWTDTPTVYPWRVQVWRPVTISTNTFEMVAESAPFYVSSPGLQIADLAGLLPCKTGDKLGLVVPPGATVGTAGTAGNQIQAFAGNVHSGQATFADVANTIFMIDAYGVGPNVAIIGDSNSVGRGPGLNGGAGWSFYESSPLGSGAGTTPDWTANLLYACQDADPRLRVACYGQGSQVLSGVISNNLPDALNANPHLRALVFLIGNNDIFLNGSNWAAMQPSYDAIYALAGTALPLFFLTLLPFTANSDAQAAEVRNVNSHFYTWAASKPNVTIINAHDAIAQVKPSTGLLDIYNPIYQRGDDLHINGLGVQQIVPLLQPALSAALFG